MRLYPIDKSLVCLQGLADISKFYPPTHVKTQKHILASMIYFLIRIEYNQTLQENRMLSILFYGRKSIFFSFSWSQS
jgi:hypothetical protein